MRRSILLLALLPALTAGSAVAAGLNLGWDDCGGQSETLLRDFACDTNTGIHVLIGSFVAPVGLDSVNANEIVVDILTGGTSLPAWWMMQTSGGCRPTSLGVSFDFTGGPTTCYDYWADWSPDRPRVAFGYTAPYGSANRARLVAVGAINPGYAGRIETDTEVYSFKLAIDHAHTIGAGSCAGCQDGACVVFSFLKVYQNPHSTGGTKILASPAVRLFAIWQSGKIDAGYCLPTAVRRTTWGAVKAVYR